MPHSPQFTAAGKSILRYVYETCELLKVDKSEIPELLTDLRDAVLIGQHGNELLPHCPKPPAPQARHRVTPAEHERILKLRADGVGYTRIAQILSMAKSTVVAHANRLASGNGKMLTDPHGAADRRADDQEPPKV